MRTSRAKSIISWRDITALHMAVRLNQETPHNIDTEPKEEKRRSCRRRKCRKSFSSLTSSFLRKKWRTGEVRPGSFTPCQGSIHSLGRDFSWIHYQDSMNPRSSEDNSWDYPAKASGDYLDLYLLSGSESG